MGIMNVGKGDGHGIFVSRRINFLTDKLYHSWLVYDAREVTLSTLIAGQEYFVCVDGFNENGITSGKVFSL